MKTCPNCGSLMGDAAEKCNSCGRSFEDMPAVAPKLDLGTDTYVKPPEFADDIEENKIELTLGNEEAADQPLEQAAEAEQVAEAEQTVQAEQTDQPKEERVNLTQQAINEQKQRAQSGNGGSGGGSYDKGDFRYGAASGGGNVTGIPALVLSIIGLVLVVVFGGIGSCTGVAAFSLIFTVIGLCLSIVGCVLASRDRKMSGNTCEKANVALVLSIIGIVIGAILLIIGISCVGCIGCAACTAVNSLGR